MGQVSPDFTTLRSLLMLDASELAGPDTSAPADALLLDLTGPGVGRDGRTAAAAAFVTRMRARAYRPLLLVRIPPIDDGSTDAELDAVMPARPDGIVLSGCRDSAAVQRLGVKIAVREAEAGLAEGITAIIADAGSSASGLLALRGFRGASPRLTALAWDAAQLAAECGAEPGVFAEDEGPSTTVRTLLTLAAAAAGLAALDTASRARGEAFARECAAAKRLGFAGKIARDAGQVAVVNTVFAGPAARVAASRPRPA